MGVCKIIFYAVILEQINKKSAPEPPFLYDFVFCLLMKESMINFLSSKEN